MIAQKNISASSTLLMSLISIELEFKFDRISQENLMLTFRCESKATSDVNPSFAFKMSY